MSYYMHLLLCANKVDRKQRDERTTGGIEILLESTIVRQLLYEDISLSRTMCILYLR